MPRSEIQISRIDSDDPLRFEVVVRDRGSQTRHLVSMSRRTCEQLTGDVYTPEECIHAAFRFLLEREPKESILERFDVTLISTYFPEFERELPSYLNSG